MKNPHALADRLDQHGIGGASLRRAVAWAALERRRRRQGRQPRAWADHAARAIIQGLLEPADVAESLWWLLSQAPERGARADYLAKPEAERAADQLRFAHYLLGQAIRRLADQRTLLVADMVRAVRPMMERRAMAEPMLKAMHAINDAADRPFLAIEIHQLLAAELQRFIRQQRFRTKGRVNG